MRSKGIARGRSSFLSNQEIIPIPYDEFVLKEQEVVEGVVQKLDESYTLDDISPEMAQIMSEEPKNLISEEVWQELQLLK